MEFIPPLPIQKPLISHRNSSKGSRVGTLKQTIAVFFMQNTLSRLWFLTLGCKQVPTEYTRGIVRWAHPDGYFLNANGKKLAETYPPTHKYGNKPYTHGEKYPILRECAKDCHLLMALAFYGDRPTFKDKNGKEYVGICHHLIPDPLNYRPANLLCWLTREQHTEADRRQRALRKVVPNGDLSIFTYERLRDLQDPRSMSRELFEQELAAIRNQHFHRVDPHAVMLHDMTHHMEV